MSVVYDLGNADQWQLIYSADLQGESQVAPALNRYYPIPEFDIPIQLSSPIFAIYCESSDPYAENKYFAGFIKQRIRTGITGGGGNDGLLTQQKFYLRQTNIIKFERVSTAYTATISIPWWIRQMSLSVYEYVGLIGDVVEQQIEDLQNSFIQCCNDLKLAIAVGSSSTPDILEKLNTIQLSLLELSQANSQPVDSQTSNYTTANFINLL